jgi:hypothetical protein
LAANAVTSDKITDGAVGLSDLADGSSVGQLLQWNGSAWVLVDGDTIGTDDQESDEVDLETNVDLDQDGTNETNVQEALSALDAMPKIYATGKVAGTGTAVTIYGASVSRINEGDYQVTFDTALSNANYIIQVATLDCGGDCPGNTTQTYDDPGITYYNQATTGFRVNIGDSDNGTTQKDDIDLEFMFTVIVIP